MAATTMRLRILRFLEGGAVSTMLLIGCSADSGPSPRDAGAGMNGRADGMGGMGGVASGDAALPGSCTRTPVGVCCDSVVCFSHAEVAARLANGRFGPFDFDAGDLPGSCPPTLPQSGVCTFFDKGLHSESDHECCYIQTSGSCCGRPFIVGSVALAAPVRMRGDWSGRVLEAAPSLDGATLRALARAWLDDARLEHASIASFTRFTMQLLELGAPAELVSDAQRAGLDEVEHARLCFALASRYAGQALGPGALATSGGHGPVDLPAAAAAAVREGCVGETLAALQVQAQLAQASDPQVRAALARIADDEARHAELAWRFARWAIAEGGAAVRNAVAGAFDAALAELRARRPRRDLGDVALDAWHAHGRLTPAEELACQLDAARTVLEPCAHALLRG